MNSRQRVIVGGVLFFLNFAVSACALDNVDFKKLTPVHLEDLRLSTDEVGAYGSTIVKFEIDETGKVTKAQAEYGPKALSKAVAEALLHSTFQPYLKNGRAVAVRSELSIERDYADVSTDTIIKRDDGTFLRVQLPLQKAISMLISNVTPHYPIEARTAFIQGVVKYRVIVSKEGKVQQLDLIHGHPLLEPAARAGVQQYRYQPYLLNGVPTEFETIVNVVFELTKR